MTNQSTGVIKYGDDKQLALEISMIKRGVAGGYKLSDDDAKALLIASKFSGLDPYNCEIYMIPGRGVMVASKVTSADAITAAAKRGNSLQVSYDAINDQMALFAESGCTKGDVVVRCNIIDMKLRGRWFDEHNALVDSYKKMGYEPKELRALVTEIIGDRPPTIWALGIVRASEDFGGPDGDKRYPRSDRARKRALKRALNAGGYFTTTMQRNFGGVPVIDEAESASGEYVEGEVISRGPVWTEPETKATSMTHEQRAAALGRTDSDSLIDDKPATTATTSTTTNGNGHGDPPATAPEGIDTTAVQKHVDNAKRALSTGSYPSAKSASAVYGMLKGVAKARGFTNDELTPFSPGDDPHITALLHSIKGLGEAIIAKPVTEAQKLDANGEPFMFA